MKDIYSNIYESHKKEEKLHFTLIDPAEVKPARAAGMAEMAKGCGTDLILVGGSTGVTMENVTMVTKAIKEVVDLPIVLFPSSGQAFSFDLDAVLFLCLMNSKNPYYITGIQSEVALLLKNISQEIISTGYLIFHPGMEAGRVGQADLFSVEDNDKALGYALAAEILGMKLIYLERGSGAEEPLPARLVSKVASQLSIPVAVGGGIRRPEQAREIREAGASIIVTGTLIESGNDSMLREVIKAAKE